MKTVLAILMFISTAAFAHEGHDHDAPKGVQAPKGGVIKAFDDHYAEVVSKRKDLKIYFYNKDLKQLDIKNIKVSASAMMPRTKKKEAVPLKTNAEGFEASYDAKGSHRYTLILNIKIAGEDQDEELHFTVEPKK